MNTIEVRLKSGFDILNLLDRRRSVCEDENLGSGIEKLVVIPELDEIETEWELNPAPGQVCQVKVASKARCWRGFYD